MVQPTPAMAATTPRYEDRVQLDEDREPLLADERRQDSVLFGTDGAGLPPPLEDPRARRDSVTSSAWPATPLSTAIAPISSIRCTIHPPTQKARVWVSGDGAMLTDSTGREYIDGLSGLWNVNIGHGRKELGEAARAQMDTLAFSSAYAGGTNERAIELADKLSALMYPSINTFFFTSGGAEASETSFKTARFYWKAVGKPESSR